ncbi:hypothetical protein D3C83_30960 [compost metagenome]
MLVHQLGAHAEAALHPLRETARKAPHRVLAAVGAGGQPDHQPHRAPFPDQLLDGGEAGPVVRGGERRQGMGEPGLEVADRDADALGAEIEGEHRAGARVMGGG